MMVIGRLYAEDIRASIAGWTTVSIDAASRDLMSDRDPWLAAAGERKMPAGALVR
ncbi:MAG TPA: hypothetical protein VIY86_00675 [Pirellulaceae bacterium]